MSANIANQVAYLRTTRTFADDDVEKLSLELNKAYLDTASAVNSRTIGLHTVNKSAVTGEEWFITQNQKQQALRQVFSFGAIAAGASLSIPYTFQGIQQFSKIYGTCKTALPDSRPIPYASVAANGNIDVRVDASNIIINVGAASPNVLSGIIVLEYLSNP